MRVCMSIWSKFSFAAFMVVLGGVSSFAFVPAARFPSRTLGAHFSKSRALASGTRFLRSQREIPSFYDRQIPFPSVAKDGDNKIVLPEFGQEQAKAARIITDLVSNLTPSKKRTFTLEIEGDPDEVFAKLREVGLANKTVMHFQDAESPPLKEFKGGESKAKDDSSHPEYFKTPLRDLIFRRSGILVALLLLQSVSSVVLSNYQGLIEQNVFLALFLTMLTGTGGNAGNQSSALVIRGLSTGEINKSNRWLVILRELMASSAIALVLSGAAFARVLLTHGCNLNAALIISATTFVTVVVAIGGGTAVPLVLDRMGIDPVHLSSPILATLTDVMGVLLLCIITTAVAGHL
mmetsp:Transcript_30022/g.60521  ORF Transcript_30022/g.60521 Transcript_30022/m.60521 type:complete len:349 (+) Transcript_30022:88-1134(+)